MSFPTLPSARSLVILPALFAATIPTAAQAACPTGAGEII